MKVMRTEAESLGVQDLFSVGDESVGDESVGDEGAHVHCWYNRGQIIRGKR